MGLIVGLAGGIAGGALAQSDSAGGSLTQSVLYALAALAVDTETNAESIVELRDRLDKLEVRMAAQDSASK